MQYRYGLLESWKMSVSFKPDGSCWGPLHVRPCVLLCDLHPAHETLLIPCVAQAGPLCCASTSFSVSHRQSFSEYDEIFFSQTLPRQHAKGTAVVGQALAVHGMYNVQRRRCPELDEEEAYLAQYHRLALAYCARPL